MPRLKVDDGAELNYRLDDFRDPWIAEEEEGDTILMHHGFARNMKWWIPWVPAVSRKYRVLRFDMRGCGESSVPPEGSVLPIERFVKDALCLIDHLGIDKIHWVGFDSGGAVGEVFAFTYPDRIKSLTLCNSPCKITDELRSTYSLGWENEWTAIENLGMREFLTQTMGRRMDLSKADPKMLEWHIAEQSKTPKHVAELWLKIINTGDISPRLSEIKAPTLLLVGDGSTISPLEQQRFMQREIPNSKLIVFDNMGHGIHLLIPDRCVEELLAFLQTID